MHVALECLACFAKQAVHTVKRLELDADVGRRAVSQVLMTLSEADPAMETVTLARMVHEVIADHAGCADPYATYKSQMNMWMQKVLETMERDRGGAMEMDDWIRLSVGGNVIDLGALPDLDIERVNRALLEAASTPFFVDHIHHLKKAISAVPSVMVIGDNAGEIVLDARLIRAMGDKKVTYVVRGGPILNDATRADAEEVGMHRWAGIMDTGSRIPGVVLDACDPEFRAAFDAAPLILAKGQGNFESLMGKTDKRLFFLLMAKCPRVARILGCEVGAYVVADQQQFNPLNDPKTSHDHGGSS